MDFNNFYISGNRNDCPLQVSYLLIYFICDANTTPLGFTARLIQWVILLHYKSMQCDVSFAQCSVNTLFRWGGHVFHVCVKIFTAYSSAKIIKIEVFLELWSQAYGHVFMGHSVVLFINFLTQTMNQCTVNLRRNFKTSRQHTTVNYKQPLHRPSNGRADTCLHDAIVRSHRANGVWDVLYAGRVGVAC